MTIQDLAVSDNGNYECVGVNREGEGICHNPYQLNVVCKCLCFFTIRLNTGTNAFTFID